MKFILNSILVGLVACLPISCNYFINGYAFAKKDVLTKEPQLVCKTPTPKQTVVLKQKVTRSSPLVKTNKGVKRPTLRTEKKPTVIAQTRNSNSVLQLGTVTAEQLNKQFARYKNSRLQGKGQVFINMEKKYGISAKFMAAIATQESGAGSSKRARSHNDCFGMTGFRGKKWASIDSNIESAFSLIDRVYIKHGRTTVPSIGKKYCVGGNWASKVLGHMNTIGRL